MIFTSRVVTGFAPNSFDEGPLLTEPFVALLPDNLVADVLDEVELIRSGTTNAESPQIEPLSDPAISLVVKWPS